MTLEELLAQVKAGGQPDLWGKRIRAECALPMAAIQKDIKSALFEVADGGLPAVQAILEPYLDNMLELTAFALCCALTAGGAEQMPKPLRDLVVELYAKKVIALCKQNLTESP